MIFLKLNILTVALVVLAFSQVSPGLKDNAVTITDVKSKSGIQFIEEDWDQALKTAKDKNKLIFLDIYATWCGPCKMMAPILKQVKDQVGDKTTIIKIDIDKNREAAEHFQIQGVPTLILFKNGEIMWRQSGVVPANTLLQIVNQF
jgi:thioredoxin 1